MGVLSLTRRPRGPPQIVVKPRIAMGEKSPLDFGVWCGRRRNERGNETPFQISIYAVFVVCDICRHMLCVVNILSFSLREGPNGPFLISAFLVKNKFGNRVFLIVLQMPIGNMV
jgi:hypothetical protein